VAVVDDRVLIPLSGTRLDLATGEPVGTGSRGGGERMWAELVEGRMVVHVGEGSATLAQDEVLLSIDDSLGAGLVLGQHPDGGAVARLRSPGAEVWRHEGCSPDVRLQHRVVLACWPSRCSARSVGGCGAAGAAGGTCACRTGWAARAGRRAGTASGWSASRRRPVRRSGPWRARTVLSPPRATRSCSPATAARASSRS